jgi:uncharacterized protein involved in exopolysaccharide biosynthesis
MKEGQSRMTAPVKFAAPASEPGAADPRGQYEQITRNVLRVAWAQRRLLASAVATAMVMAAAGLAYTGPRCTAEALIHVTFTRAEPATAVRAAPVAAMDAGTVVESAARLLRSRALASAVVSRLGLDRETPPQSLGARILTRAAAAAGISNGPPSAHDAAVARLLGQVKVTNDLRSYLISVGVTAADPARAARLANAVATEYLRGQAFTQAEESYAASKHEANDLSAVYGPRHPAYLDARAKQTRAEQQLTALRDAPSEALGSEAIVIGQTLLPAEKALVPSGPNAAIVFAIAAMLGLLAGLALALRVFLHLGLKSLTLDWRLTHGGKMGCRASGNLWRESNGR